MRPTPLLLLAASLAALLAPAASAAFGAGPVAFEEHVVPGAGAAEPTIGIPWNTDNVFYHETATTYRGHFEEGADPVWDDVTAPYQVPTNLDPMLVADPDTGRIFAGGLHGVCSWMMYSDDDGETWLPTLNMCSGPNFDHQSIGLGPPAGPIPSPEGTHIGYYCAQGGTISCARSLDQGSTWGPFQDVPGPCQGFHGHIRVSTITGFLGLPTAECGGHNGFISTSDGGLTWKSNSIPYTADWTNGFDPSLQFTRPGGWMYYAMASERGVYVALSTDAGLGGEPTWQPLGGGMGVNATPWLDIGQFHDPPVVSGVFTNVQAGDDDRVAVSFIGLEGGPGKDIEFLTSTDIYQCDERQDELVWYFYAAFSYDAGQTWTVQRVSDDPAQVGGVWDVLIGGNGACRNLLDFNDMDIDSQGRVYYGVADGCTATCAESMAPDSQGYRDSAPRLFRQVGGKGLFAAFDQVDPDDLDADGIPNAEDPDADGDGVPDQPADEPKDEESPGLGLAFLLAALALAAFVRRR